MKQDGRKRSDVLPGGLFGSRIFQLVLMLLAGFLLGWIIFRDAGGHVHGAQGSSDARSGGNPVEAAVYTCSMHPQIRQNEPGKCPICGMDLVPLKAKGAEGREMGGKPFSPYVHAMSPEAVALANIQTVRVDYMDPDHELSLSGRIAVNEQNLAVITANFSGRIEKLFIDFTGQPVKKGQRLASLYSPDLITAQKELLEAARNKEGNPVLYRAVREKLKLWKISDAQIASMEAAGSVKQQVDIHADVSGIVLNRGFSTGDFVNRGDILFEIADLSKVWVLLDAYESDLSRIRTGEKVVFTVASMPGREFSSTVRFVDPVVNPQTRTASVRAEIANPGLVLKPDMFVNAKLKAGATAGVTGGASSEAPTGTSASGREKVLRIPKSAVLWTGERSVVYVEASTGDFPAFEMREITLGARAGDYYVIAAGLRPGDKVVVNGVFSIDAAAQLSGNYSMMNKPGGAARNVPDAFTGQLTALVEAYLDAKNALVESDVDGADEAVKKLGPALGKVEAGALKGEQASAWKKMEKPLRAALGKLAAAGDLEAKREHFKSFSDALIPAVDFFGVKGASLYLNHCPMASNSDGAYWLSESEEIRNPYYGESMLSCGDVKKVIPPVKAGDAAGGGEPGSSGVAPAHRH